MGSGGVSPASAFRSRCTAAVVGSSPIEGNGLRTKVLRPLYQVG